MSLWRPRHFERRYKPVWFHSFMEPVKGSPEISPQKAALRQSVQHRVSFLRLPSYTLSRCAGLPLKGKQGLAAELAMCCLSPAKHSAEFATPPLVPYGTTFLHGKASHLVLRSLSLPYEPSSLAPPLCGVSPAERARGNAFPSPARAVVWFYHNGALYFFRGAHQGRQPIAPLPNKHSFDLFPRFM